MRFLLISIVAVAVGVIAPPVVSHSFAREPRLAQVAARTPTLQELIHDMAVEGRKGLPRKKMESPGGAIWLVSIDDRQNQLALTYEISGGAQEVFDQNTYQEWRQESVGTFRLRCGDPYLGGLLRQGMTIAHIYRGRQSGKTLVVFVFSQRDC